MPTSRMEAFSHGVVAILITVMVLELHVPHGTTWGALHESLPTLLTYVVSFVYLGIYWTNHHHILMLTERVGRSGALGEPAPAVLVVVGVQYGGLTPAGEAFCGCARLVR